MPNLATWIRAKDSKSFRQIFRKHPEIKVWNARTRNIRMDQMDGLLLTGGSDISPEFLRLKVLDPSVLDKQIEPERDRWEFAAVREALARGLPIFAICKGLQVFNVALGGTLKLDIKGHNLPEQRDREIQPLHHSRRTSHRFPKVNSAHHRQSNDSETIWKLKRGPRTMESSSKYISKNIPSLALCSITPSEAAFTTRSSKTSSRDWRRINASAACIELQRAGAAEREVQLRCHTCPAA